MTITKPPPCTKRDSYLRRVYGISLAQYNELLEKQGGGCAICLREASSFTKNLCVDHDHKTGEVRGILCHYCNRYLVGRHRDASLLRRIADYISAGTGYYVPPKQKKIKKRKRRAKVRSRRSKG